MSPWGEPRALTENSISHTDTEDQTQAPVVRLGRELTAQRSLHSNQTGT